MPPPTMAMRGLVLGFSEDIFESKCDQPRECMLCLLVMRGRGSRLFYDIRRDHGSGPWRPMLLTLEAPTSHSFPDEGEFVADT